jgi:hypothetical protein
MFEVYEHLSKDKIILQLRKDGKVVEGFDYQIAVEKKKDWEVLRKMLLKEANKRNKGIIQRRPSSR